MKRGRPANPVPTIDWKCHIPLPIAAKVDIFLLDPVTLKTRHGARSALVTQLLIQWLSTKGIDNPLKGNENGEAKDAGEEACTIPAQAGQEVLNG